MGEEIESQARIVPMEESHLDEVVRIEAFSTQTSWSQRSFLGELKNPHSFCFTLRQGDEASESVVGFVCFQIVGEESELLNLGIHPQYRKRGLGRRLMQFYIDFCQARNVKTFYLETGVSNAAAIRLYQSYRYRPAGTRSKLYAGKEDALLMVRRGAAEAPSQ